MSKSGVKNKTAKKVYTTYTTFAYEIFNDDIGQKTYKNIDDYFAKVKAKIKHDLEKWKKNALLYEDWGDDDEHIFSNLDPLESCLRKYDYKILSEICNHKDIKGKTFDDCFDIASIEYELGSELIETCAIIRFTKKEWFHTTFTNLVNSIVEREDEKYKKVTESHLAKRKAEVLREAKKLGLRVIDDKGV